MANTLLGIALLEVVALEKPDNDSELTLTVIAQSQSTSGPIWSTTFTVDRGIAPEIGDYVQIIIQKES